MKTHQILPKFFSFSVSFSLPPPRPLSLFSYEAKRELRDSINDMAQKWPSHKLLTDFYPTTRGPQTSQHAESSPLFFPWATIWHCFYFFCMLGTNNTQEHEVMTGKNEMKFKFQCLDNNFGTRTQPYPFTDVLSVPPSVPPGPAESLWPGYSRPQSPKYLIRSPSIKTFQTALWALLWTEVFWGYTTYNMTWLNRVRGAFSELLLYF